MEITQDQSNQNASGVISPKLTIKRLNNKTKIEEKKF